MLLTLIIGGALMPLLWFVTGAMHFPPVFQIMFVIYVLLGLMVFLLLDAPPVQKVGGWKAVIALLVFYAVISAAYVLGASILPQYNPAVEKEKIDKIVKPKMETPEQRHARLEALLKKAEELQVKTDTLLAALNTFSPPPAASVSSPASVQPASTGGDVIARGKEVYDLQECYNCHKIGGKGSVKKRGPVLDNIGSLMKHEEMKEKLLNPRSWMAEGFEKEYNKKLMPDKYKELMSDQEIDELVAYLSTLKDASVQTPKPIEK